MNKKSTCLLVQGPFTHLSKYTLVKYVVPNTSCQQLSWTLIFKQLFIWTLNKFLSLYTIPSHINAVILLFVITIVLIVFLIHYYSITTVLKIDKNLSMKYVSHSMVSETCVWRSMVALEIFYIMTWHTKVTTASFIAHVKIIKVMFKCPIFFGQYTKFRIRKKTSLFNDEYEVCDR